MPGSKSFLDKNRLWRVARRVSWRVQNTVKHCVWGPFLSPGHYMYKYAWKVIVKYISLLSKMPRTLIQIQIFEIWLKWNIFKKNILPRTLKNSMCPTYFYTSLWNIIIEILQKSFFCWIIVWLSNLCFAYILFKKKKKVHNNLVKLYFLVMLHSCNFLPVTASGGNGTLHKSHFQKEVALCLPKAKAAPEKRCCCSI